MSIQEVRSLVDTYIRTRVERLSLERQAAAVKKRENELKELIIKVGDENKIATVPGGIGNANVNKKSKPKVEKWDPFYEYVRHYNAFDLLHKRVTDKAVIERWDDGIEIPGVVSFPTYTLSISDYVGEATDLKETEKDY